MKDRLNKSVHRLTHKKDVTATITTIHKKISIKMYLCVIGNIHIFFAYPLWGLHSHLFVCLKLYQNSWCCVSCFHLFCFIFNSFWDVFKFTAIFFWISNLLFTPLSIYFFTSDIMVFISRKSIWDFLKNIQSLELKQMEDGMRKRLYVYIYI